MPAIAPAAVKATPPLPTPNPAIGALASEFSQIASDVSAGRGKLAGMEGRQYPSDGWDTWFANTANRLANARDGLLHVAPQAQGLGEALKGDTLELSRDGGIMREMQTHRSTVGYGWGRSLDNVINDAQRAVTTLVNLTPPPAA